MKKAIITIISILYLVSGIGFASVHRYCHNSQETAQACESNCCSAEPVSVSSTACKQAENPDSDPCCAVPVSNSPVRGSDTALSDNCCHVQHTYNQLDSTSLPLNNYASLAANAGSDLHYYPQAPQKIDGSAKRIIADPLTHVTLPLLI